MAFLPWVDKDKVSEAGSARPTGTDDEGWAVAVPEPATVGYVAPGPAALDVAASERIAELSAHITGQLGTSEPGDPHDSPEDEAVEAPEEIDPERIADRIVRGLSRKSLSVAEVEAQLYTEGVAEKDALEIIERFSRFGYLDDLRMAEQLVASLRERKKLGRSSIQQELRARKLDPDAIATALDELDGDDEYRTALELARKRLPSLRSLSDEVAERRLTGFLARRGYSGGLVQRVVRETVRRSGPSIRFR
ncbi:RecX family transcriptional regulator [Rathayibacter agropyri]|uniref:RecX family transcriptional regulator n=1 Tax=Rathayibacter agropyri TaxID=1634927 RepID=UPI001562EACB|nr:regulatory protein RecX [Rathayibacter agropyri]